MELSKDEIQFLIEAIDCFDEEGFSNLSNDLYNRIKEKEEVDDYAARLHSKLRAALE